MTNKISEIPSTKKKTVIPTEKLAEAVQRLSEICMDYCHSLSSSGHASAANMTAMNVKNRVELLFEHLKQIDTPQEKD